VNDIRSWLQTAIERYKSTLPEEYSPDILLLCGCSGCCKSTTVKVLCQELRIGTIEWSEDTLASESVSFNALSTGAYRQLPIDAASDMGGRTDSRASVMIDDFTLRSSYPSLAVSRRGANSSQSAAPPVPIAAAQEPFDGLDPQHGTHVILVHDPAALITMTRERGDNGGSLSYGKDGVAPVLSVLRHPAVLIVSDVTGRDDMPFVVDSLIPKHLRAE
ncbi:unnamed protein product, partial [Symbiodinium microadriaticum]